MGQVTIYLDRETEAKARADPQIGGEGHRPRPRVEMYALDTNTLLDYFKGKGEVANPPCHL